MQKNIFALAFLGLTICASNEYFIEINPNNGEAPYEMKLGEAKTFVVSGYQKTADTDTLVGLEDKIWWEFDKSLLEMVSQDQDGSSITLKAIKPGIGELSAATLIKTNLCQKKIIIVVAESP